MALRTAVVGAITAGVTAGLAANRRRNLELIPTTYPRPAEAPFVEVIIPARNEERNIGPLLSTLLAQEYPRERFRVTVVDDASTDLTSFVVKRYCGQSDLVRLVCASPLPTGWTGKNHAMYTGYVAAKAGADFLLFADADTRHHPLMLATTVARAEAARSDLLSLVIDVDMRSFWERVLVPQVGELYTLLVGTMDTVNTRGKTKGAAANGQFMLIRPDAYAEALALAEVRSDVAEDRAIAHALKMAGRNVRLEYGRKLVRARVYSSLREMWSGYSKTLFWATGHDSVRALAVMAALCFYALSPIVTLLSLLTLRDRGARRTTLAHGLAQLLPMLALRAWVCRTMGVPARYALAYPLGVMVGNAMLLFSLLSVLSGRGVVWKGRTYK